MSKKQIRSKDSSAPGNSDHSEKSTSNLPIWLFCFLVVGAGALTAVVALKKGQRTPQEPPRAVAGSKVLSGVQPASSREDHDHAHDHSHDAKPSDGSAHGETAEPSAMSEAERAVGLLNIGNELLAEGKIDEAIEQYKHSLLHDPGSEDTHYNMGLALARAGRLDEAIAHYKEALRILPDYAEAHNNLGNILAKQNKLEEAMDHFNKALEVNPDYASAHNNLGTALARQGKITDATVHFAKAVSITPDYVDARYNLATAYLNQRRNAEALAELNEILRINPGFGPARRALAALQQKATGAIKP